MLQSFGHRLRQIGILRQEVALFGFHLHVKDVRGYSALQSFRLIDSILNILGLLLVGH